MYSNIEETIEAIKNGEIIIVGDNEEYESEGYFVSSGELVTGENVNFMATHGKGLISMPISENIANFLELDIMKQTNKESYQTVSIDHVDTTNGISAFERALTIQKVAEGDIASSFKRQGHIFPLVANKYGVLVHKEHSEATIDLMRLANLKEVGVCCEIMDANGNMMKRDGLFELAKIHDLKIITIEALNKYFKKNNPFVKREAEVILPTKHGDFKTYVYYDYINNKEHLALVKGEITENMLCRVHSECLTGDVFGSRRCDCGEQLDKSMELIDKHGSGVILYLRQEGRGIGLTNKLKAYELQDTGIDTYDANIKLGFDPDMREYDIAVNILNDLKIGSVDLITNNPEKINELTKYGITIKSRVVLNINANEKNINYLKTKKERMGHLFEEL